ncbi:type IV-A pilus assembly ATPase PilB [Endozoicomonadaceae bacterium StTr2]
MPEIKLTGLARRLVLDKLIDENTAKDIAADAARHKVAFVTQLVENGAIDARKLAEVCSDEFGMPLLDLDSFDPDQLPREIVDEKLIRKHHLLPLLQRGNKLFLAASDPAAMSGIDEIRFNTGLQIDIVLVEENKLTRLIDLLLDGADQALAGLDNDELDNLDTVEASDAADASASSDEANDAPVVRFVNKMLLSAIKKGASDLHFEPYERSYRIRFRTDGVLEEAARPPIGLSPKLSSRLKIMAGLDISERRKPQDGRIKLKLSKSKAIDFRVNTLPTLWGEKIVLRILDPSSAKMGIDALGYEEHQKEMYLEALHQPQGMILVTGPTGSGKTVSLYTGLNILNTVERNISTAEDPVEINLEGINQVNVNPKQGLDFAQALRAFLRQDPDIIMVGEIRDLETANIAIKAAQTGHMVMSTLHTNSAAETLTRLMNMGVPAFNIATSISLIIAQRLARRLCNACKEKVDIPVETLLEEGFTEEQAQSAELYAPQGCRECNKGFKGRVGIYEVVSITPGMQQIIMSEGNSLEIAAQAENEGFNSLRQSGILKALAGVTSLEEVNRVTQD